jgi:IclR family mhp operon transcriptional activator
MGRVVASFGVTYFTTALSETEACQRYVPVLKSASAEITQDLARIARTSFGWSSDKAVADDQTQPLHPPSA